MMRANLQKLLAVILVLAISLAASGQRQSRSTPSVQSFDVIIKGGTVYDGTGSSGVKTDVGIKGDRIVAVGNLSRSTAPTIVDATNLAVAPGFINLRARRRVSSHLRL